MGCDIHSWAEIKVNGKWLKVEDEIFGEGAYKTNEPFGWRSYSVFAFLANVRNYDHCIPISEPKGLPNDSEYLNEPSDYAYNINPMNGENILKGNRITKKEEAYDDNHSHSWLSLKELLEFDYNQTFWNRRITKQTSPNVWDGASLAEEGEGTILSYRENLSESFFNDLNTLKTLGAPENVRIVFYFDN